jgi:hypothetical protein
MPPAGQRPADRATAHYRWAERYTKRGNAGKAVAHFGRARHLEFGAVIDEKLEQWDIMINKYEKFCVKHTPVDGGGTAGTTTCFSSPTSDPSTRAYYEMHTGQKTGTVELVLCIDKRLEDIYTMLRKYEKFDVEHKPLNGSTTRGCFSRDNCYRDRLGETTKYNNFLNATSGTVMLIGFQSYVPPPERERRERIERERRERERREDVKQRAIKDVRLAWETDDGEVVLLEQVDEDIRGGAVAR